MYYIHTQANETGSYGNPVSVRRKDMAALPDEMLADYVSARGFAELTIENGTVTALKVNQAALDAYLAEHPETQDPDETLELSAENKLLRAQIAATADRQEFLEDCIAEMAMQVYSA